MKYKKILFIITFLFIGSNTAFSQDQKVIDLIDSMDKYYNDNDILSKSFGYKALKLAEESNESKNIALVHQHLASNYIIWDDYDSAILCAEKAKEMYLSMDDSLNSLYCQQYIISAYQLKEDYQIAIFECKKFLQNPLVLKNDKLYYKMLQNLAIMYGSTDYYEIAISLYNKALEYFLTINDTIRILNSCNDIMLLHSLTDYANGFEEPIKLFKMSYPLALSINNLQRQSILLSRMSHVYLESGDFQKAKNYLEQSLSLKEEMEDLEGLSYGYQDMVEIYSREGNIEMAINYLQRSMKIDSELKDHSNICHDYELMGSLLQKQRNFKESIAYFDQAIEIAQEYGFWQQLLESLKSKTLSYAALENFDEADKTFAKYIEYYEIYNISDKNEKIFWEQELNKKIELEKALALQKEHKITVIQTLAACLGIILLCWLFFSFEKLSRRSKK